MMESHKIESKTYSFIIRGYTTEYYTMGITLVNGADDGF